MSRWTRRAITGGIVFLLLIYMYRLMTRLHMPLQKILIVYGALAILSGIVGFVSKPDEKFAALTRFESTGRPRIVSNAFWILLGSILIAWSLLSPHVSR